VKAVPGLVQQRVVEIGGKHLEFTHAGGIFRRFDERHRDRIRFLAGGTAEHPDADRVVAARLQQLGKDLALENLESTRAAEKTRHANENVGVKGVELFGVASKESRVVLQRGFLV